VDDWLNLRTHRYDLTGEGAIKRKQKQLPPVRFAWSKKARILGSHSPSDTIPPAKPSTDWRPLHPSVTLYGDVEMNPGPENTPLNSPTTEDYAVVPRLVNSILRAFDAGIPSADAFAAPWNTRFPSFWSESDDGFSKNWRLEPFLCINAPFSRIHDVVTKLIRDDPKAIVITPVWHSWWFATLQNLAAREFILEGDPIFLRRSSTPMPPLSWSALACLLLPRKIPLCTSTASRSEHHPSPWRLCGAKEELASTLATPSPLTTALETHRSPARTRVLATPRTWAPTSFFATRALAPPWARTLTPFCATRALTAPGTWAMSLISSTRAFNAHAPRFRFPSSPPSAARRGSAGGELFVTACTAPAFFLRTSHSASTRSSLSTHLNISTHVSFLVAHLTSSRPPPGTNHP
jgi:hypothetical protein